MNTKTANQILKLYNLGISKSNPIKITGGLIHQMWQIESQKGKFAIKQINSEIATRPGVIQNMNLCEASSYKFYNIGLPTIYAIELNSNFVTEVEGIFYLVYNWFEGKALTSNNDIDLSAIIKITTIFAKIHKANLQIGEKPNTIEVFPPYDDWLDIQKTLAQKDDDWVDKCLTFIDELKLWYSNTKIVNANVNLQNNFVFSHRDLDKKNVLWNNSNEPCIVDWETAGYINSTKDLVQFALDWSEKGNGEIDLSLFPEIFKTYKLYNKINFDLIEEAFYSILGGMPDWLKFNIHRALSCPQNSSEYENAIIEIPKTIDKITLRYKNIDKILSSNL